MSFSKPRVYKNLTFAEKVAVIREVEKGVKKKCQIANEYGIAPNFVGTLKDKPTSKKSSIKLKFLFPLNVNRDWLPMSQRDPLNQTVPPTKEAPLCVYCCHFLLPKVKKLLKQKTKKKTKKT